MQDPRLMDLLSHQVTVAPSFLSSSSSSNQSSSGFDILDISSYVMHSTALSPDISSFLKHMFHAKLLYERREVPSLPKPKWSIFHMYL